MGGWRGGEQNDSYIANPSWGLCLGEGAGRDSAIRAAVAGRSVYPGGG